MISPFFLRLWCFLTDLYWQHYGCCVCASSLGAVYHVILSPVPRCTVSETSLFWIRSVAVVPSVQNWDERGRGAGGRLTYTVTRDSCACIVLATYSALTRWECVNRVWDNGNVWTGYEITGIQDKYFSIFGEFCKKHQIIQKTFFARWSFSWSHIYNIILCTNC